MKVPFTADVCARAIIAACASYGDDPVKVMTATNSVHRRALPPAGAAIQVVTGVARIRVTRALGLGLTSIVNGDARGTAGHLKAKTAALAAIGGATALLAPEPGPPKRERRPDPETVSDLPDALLAPRPIAPPIVVAVVETKALPTPVTPPVSIRADPNVQIRDMLGQGLTNTKIAAALGVTIGVVAGQRRRLQLAGLRAPADFRSAAAKPAKPDPDLFVGRAAPAPRFERLEPTRDDRIPQPTHDRIAPSDQALISEAVARGKVTTLPAACAENGYARGLTVPDHPAPMRFDPIKRKFSRGEGATRTGGFNT